MGAGDISLKTKATYPLRSEVKEERLEVIETLGVTVKQLKSGGSSVSPKEEQTISSVRKVVGIRKVNGH